MAEQFSGGVVPGSTNVSLFIVPRALGTSIELVGVVANQVVATYWRAGSMPVAIPIVALTTPADAWTAGGWVAIEPTRAPGAYRLDVPAAAFIAGADYVMVIVAIPGAFLFCQQFPLGAPSHLNLTQSLSITHPVGTVGEALLGGRAAGLDNWQFGVDGLGAYWQVVSWDNTTPLLVFAQDAVDAPTYRMKR